MEAVQQVSAIQGQGVRRPPVGERRIEFPHVAVQEIRVDGELRVSPALDDIGAQCLSQAIRRFAQRGTGTLFVGVGPELEEDSIPPLKPVRPGEREVGEQSQTLRLPQNLQDLLSVGIVQIDTAQRAQSDGQCRPPFRLASPVSRSEGASDDCLGARGRLSNIPKKLKTVEGQCSSETR